MLTLKNVEVGKSYKTARGNFVHVKAVVADSITLTQGRKTWIVSTSQFLKMVNDQ